MNKLTKVGCSALCGSLAAISAANAGDLTVTGGADMTFVSVSNGTTGNPYGIGSNVNFKFSGEFDNGWTWAGTTAYANAGAFSASNIGFTMGGLGKLNLNQGNSGNGVQAIDDKMPTAWEEPWGAGGLTTGIKLVYGSGKSGNIMYTTPTVAGTTLTFTLAPAHGKADTADKTVSGRDLGTAESYDATFNINPSLGTEILSGLNLFGGAATIAKNSGVASLDEDQYHAVGGITYDLGPVSLGWQVSGVTTGVEESSEGYNAYKSHAFGVALNVNDDLSISYGQHESRKAGYTVARVQTAENTRRVEVESWQIAYTMGGASFRLADSTVDNAAFTGGKQESATTVSLGLAF
jgi:hypothetical protein